jgi:hypothetical protein
MKFKIEKIVEDEDGRVFTVSEHNEARGKRVRLLRAPHLETDVVVSPATEDSINQIRDKK